MCKFCFYSPKQKKQKEPLLFVHNKENGKKW